MALPDRRRPLWVAGLLAAGLLSSSVWAQTPPAPLPAPTPAPAPAPAPGQDPAPPAKPSKEAARLEPRVQELIDRFLGAMPHDPLALRSAPTRQSLAPKALPVLREVREFVAANPQCAIADRVHEFTVFALVLGEPGLRESIDGRAKAGDASAGALLGAADAILAADPKQRTAALAAVAKGLRARPSEAACAVQCVVVAGDLTEVEARQLADSADGDLAGRLRSVADAAARDPRRKLDQPFEIAGKLLDGTEFSTRSLRGKVVVVDFWATWCGPCVRSLPDLVQLRKQHGDRLAIVGVDSDGDAATLRTFLAAHPEVDWPQLFAAARWHPLATELGISAIPRVFLIDREGILRSVDASKDLEALVRRYLAP